MELWKTVLWIKTLEASQSQFIRLEIQKTSDTHKRWQKVGHAIDQFNDLNWRFWRSRKCFRLFWRRMKEPLQWYKIVVFWCSKILIASFKTSDPKKVLRSSVNFKYCAKTPAIFSWFSKLINNLLTLQCQLDLRHTSWKYLCLQMRYSFGLS